MKFPYLRELGADNGWYRVGPLTRVTQCDFIPTPLAEQQRREFLAFDDGRAAKSTLGFHWARMIEMLHAAEAIEATAAGSRPAGHRSAWRAASARSAASA